MVKNKVAPPFRQSEFDIMFNEGISITGDLIDMAVEDNVVDKSGAWYSYGDVRLGQGRENAKDYLRDNPELFQEIREGVLDARIPDRNKPAVAEGAEEQADEPAGDESPEVVVKKSKKKQPEFETTEA